jgi:HrpA-like RNA helicase
VITTLGRTLAQLPVEPAVGKMLIAGALFKCLDPAVTAAACAGARSPFVSSPLLREEGQRSQRWFSKDSDLDAAVRFYVSYGSYGSYGSENTSYSAPLQIKKTFFLLGASFRLTGSQHAHLPCCASL